MKERLVLKTEAKDNADTEYRFSIEFYVFQEDEIYVAYCPALDISSCAATYNDAISAFYEMFQLHIECCVENGTLYDDLKAHGWKLRKKELLPPDVYTLMKKPEMKKLMRSRLSYERVVSSARIPSLV